MKNVFEYPDLRSAADLDFEIKIALPLFETQRTPFFCLWALFEKIAKKR